MRAHIVVLASGLARQETSSVNLGDLAQLANTVRHLRERYDADVAVFANARGDVSGVPGVEVIEEPIRYLIRSAPASKRAARLAIAGARAAWLLWNARRKRHGRRPIWLNEDGRATLDLLARSDAVIGSGAGIINDR